MDDYDNLYDVKALVKQVIDRVNGSNDEYIYDALEMYVATLQDMMYEIDAIRENIEANGGEYIH